MKEHILDPLMNSDKLITSRNECQRRKHKSQDLELTDVGCKCLSVLIFLLEWVLSLLEQTVQGYTGF